MKIYLSILLCLLAGLCSAQEEVISKIEFEGVKNCNVSFLQKLITVQEGEVVDSLVINKDVYKLQKLVAVAKAAYLLEKVGGGYKLTYQIEENLTLIPQFNVWTVNERLSYSLGLYEFNLFGRNIKVGGFYQNNGYDSYGGTFKAPYLFSKKWGMSAEYQNWISEEPLYFDDLVATYRYNNERVELMGMYELDEKNNFSLGGDLFKEVYEYKGGDDLSDISAPRVLEQDKLMFKLLHTYNNLKYDYYLISGFKNIFNLQAVVTENNYDDLFLIALNDFLFFKRVGLKGNLATRIRLGIASNVDSPFAPFTLDNNLNIRGVGNTIDRGSASAVWNIEYRQAVIEKNWFVLQTNVFMDVGTWREPGGEIADAFKAENFRIYAGGGLRFMHKKIYNAIFRVDYGYGLTNENSGGIVVGIGQYF